MISNTRNIAVKNSRVLFKVRTVIIFLLIAIPLYSQIQDNTYIKTPDINYGMSEGVDLHFETVKDWEVFKQKVIFLNEDKLTGDSLIKNYRSQIETLNKIICNKDSVISNLKNYINITKQELSFYQSEVIDLQTQKKPVFEWIGFFAGSGTSYVFSDSTINKSISNTLWNNLSIHAETLFRFKEFLITTSLIVPFNSKAFINLKIGYKIF